MAGAKKKLGLLLLVCSVQTCLCQYPSTLVRLGTSTTAWNARWIFHPSADSLAFGVFHFRKQFTLAVAPAHFIVYVSGDNRYQLFVNGKRMSSGPAKGDVAHWRYETVDLAPALKKGSNIIAALIWNEGVYLSWSQVTYQSGFIMQGAAPAESVINTGAGWKVMENKSYRAPARNAILSPFEKVQADKYPWGWEKAGYDDRAWLPAKSMEKNTTGNAASTVVRTLVASTIPVPEEIKQGFKSIRRSCGRQVNENFIKGTGALRIAGNDSVVILIDQGHLTTAFPELRVSGGKGATIRITYSEALYDSTGKKGNRNETDGKIIRGNADVFLPDGGNGRLYRPLYYRTFRYIELTIKTAAAPLQVNNFYSIFTAYPFKENAVFTCSDPSLQEIWNTGWRTARLCAYETYMDCPYYEQLQYVGDTRVQALVSYSVSGDDRLIRNAIEQYSNSFTPDGLTQSRYPESQHQVIPPFSLFWIAMLNDYWRYRPDSSFVRQYLNGIKNVLDWHARYIDTNGMLHHMPYWNFVDWSKEWSWTGEENSSGVPSGTFDGYSSILTLQYVYGLNMAVELFTAFHQDKDAARYHAIAVKLKEATLQLCWDSTRNLLADNPLKTAFSQHAAVMGVLTDLFPPETGKELIKRVAADSTLIQCTYYYRFYLNRAMNKAGWGNAYVSMLQPWREMIKLGLSTFAEKPEPTRSDCHAWSASPNYDFLSIIAGIEPASAGFKTVKIEPHLGSLEWIEGSMPVPSGQVKFALKKYGTAGITGTITLPPGLPGTFIWNGKSIRLSAGRQKIFFE